MQPKWSLRSKLQLLPLRLSDASVMNWNVSAVFSASKHWQLTGQTLNYKLLKIVLLYTPTSKWIRQEQFEKIMLKDYHCGNSYSMCYCIIWKTAVLNIKLIKPVKPVNLHRRFASYFSSEQLTIRFSGSLLVCFKMAQPGYVAAFYLLGLRYFVILCIVYIK